MIKYLKKTYPNNPFRPNSGVFENKEYTLGIAISEKQLSLINKSRFPYKGYKDCSREEYQKIIEHNAADYRERLRMPLVYNHGA